MKENVRNTKSRIGKDELNENSRDNKKIIDSLQFFLKKSFFPLYI